jgi:hypothetical protein
VRTPGENFYGKLRDNVVAHLAEMVTLHTIRPAIVGTRAARLA